METTQILKFIRNTFLFLGSIGFLAACSHQNDTQPDVSEIHIPYHTHPFYLEFATIDTNKNAEDAAALEQKYPDFLAFYLKHLVNIGYPLDDSRSQQNLHYFLTHPDYRSMFDTVNKVF